MTLPYVPAGQDTHADAPRVFEYFPVAQGVHAVTPAVTLYVPAGHGPLQVSEVSPAVAP